MADQTRDQRPEPTHTHTYLGKCNLKKTKKQKGDDHHDATPPRDSTATLCSQVSPRRSSVLSDPTRIHRVITAVSEFRALSLGNIPWIDQLPSSFDLVVRYR